MLACFELNNSLVLGLGRMVTNPFDTEINSASIAIIITGSVTAYDNNTKKIEK